MEISSKKTFLFSYCNTQLWQNYGVVMAIVARLWQMWQIWQNCGKGRKKSGSERETALIFHEFFISRPLLRAAWAAEGAAAEIRGCRGAGARVCLCGQTGAENPRVRPPTFS